MRGIASSSPLAELVVARSAPAVSNAPIENRTDTPLRWFTCGLTRSCAVSSAMTSAMKSGVRTGTVSAGGRSRLLLA